MKLAGQTVLVTGAAGFIGSHLVEHLVAAGCRVRALIHYDARPGQANLDLLDPEVRAQVEVLAGDVCDAHFMIRAVEGCAAVFHLAALIGVPYSYLAPSSYVAANVTGTLNVLEACRRVGVARVVHTSTSECYGTALRTPIDEAHPLQAQSPYAASKIGAEKLAESYYYSFDLPVSVLRPFNNYGPRQSRRAVIPAIAAQLLWGGDSISLGALDPRRDFLFVRDTCRAFSRLAETDAAIGRTVHVGSGSSVSIGELAALLMEVVGVEKPIVQDPSRLRPAKSEVRELLCDPALARELLGWEPQVSLRAGLEQVVAFLRAQPGRKGGAAYAI